jgi:hypothetical protein
MCRGLQLAHSSTDNVPDTAKPIFESSIQLLRGTPLGWHRVAQVDETTWELTMEF